MEYAHLPVLAPTQDMLNRYKKGKGDWREYEKEFTALLRERKIDNAVKREMLAESCLLCSEEAA